VDEQPAAGWLENLRVSGDQLLADLKAVPKKLADLIQTGAFRTRSVELAPVTSQTRDGKEYDAVITGLALLGAKAPAVRTLDDILAFYSEDGDSAVALLIEDADDASITRTVDMAEGDVIWNAESGANDMRCDLDRAINTLAGPPMQDGLQRYWVQDIDQVGKRAIVGDFQADASWVISYSLGEDGEPVPAPFAEWVLAEQAWVEAAKEQAAEMAEKVVAAAGRNPESRRDTKSMADENRAPFDGLELSDEQVQVFADGFGIDEADDDKRRDAVMARFSVRETPAPPGDGGGDEGEGDGDGGDEPAAKVTVASSELSELRKMAEMGVAAFKNQNAGRIEGNIQVALRQGRITPAQEKRWRKFYAEADYEMVTEHLLGLPVNPGLTRTFGSEQRDNDPQRGREDAWYREYAGRTGVPVREEAKT
jgi:hypothetical protein